MTIFSNMPDILHKMITDAHTKGYTPKRFNLTQVDFNHLKADVGEYIRNRGYGTAPDYVITGDAMFAGIPINTANVSRSHLETLPRIQSRINEDSL